MMMIWKRTLTWDEPDDGAGGARFDSRSFLMYVLSVSAGNAFTFGGGAGEDMTEEERLDGCVHVANAVFCFQPPSCCRKE